MDFIVPHLPEPVEEYLSQYDDLFASNQAREHFRHYISLPIPSSSKKPTSSSLPHNSYSFQTNPAPPQ